MNLVLSEHGHDESYPAHWISTPTPKEEQARVMPLSISFGDETRWRHRVAVWCRDGVYHLMATQSESGLDRQKPEERMHTEGAAEIPIDRPSAQPIDTIQILVSVNIQWHVNVCARRGRNHARQPGQPACLEIESRTQAYRPKKV